MSSCIREGGPGKGQLPKKMGNSIGLRPHVRTYARIHASERASVYIQFVAVGITRGCALRIGELNTRTCIRRASIRVAVAHVRTCDQIR